MQHKYKAQKRIKKLKFNKDKKFKNKIMNSDININSLKKEIILNNSKKEIHNFNK